MAVSPFRALLEMHFQSGWNRSVKELGKQGTWALVLLGTVLLCFAVLPLVGGLGVLGWLLGRGLEQAWAVPTLGGVLAALSLGGGIVNGVLGGTRVLAWERLKSFPIKLSTLFSAELVAGVGDLLPLLLSLGMAALGAGMILARPLAAPFILLATGQAIALTLVMQLLVGGLAEALMKRLRLLLFVAGALLWSVSVLSSTLADQNVKLRKGSATQSLKQQAEMKQKIVGIGQRMALIAEPLPSTQEARAVLEASQGRWGLALARQLYPLALLALLGTLAARILQREAATGSLQVAAKGPERLWGFDRPAEGIAKLQWRTLLNSTLGRFGFAVPLMAVVIIRGPFARLGAQGSWIIPASFAYLALSATQLLFNQFGLDGPAARGLLLLPLPGRELLKGKMLGFSFFYGIQSLILLALLVALGQRDAAALGSGVLLMGCLILAMGSLGQWASVWMPRPMPRNTLKNNAMPLPLLLLSIGGTLACMTVLGGVFALVAWLAPAWLLPAFALIFLLCLGLHAFFLGPNAAYLDKHRERLVENLG